MECARVDGGEGGRRRRGRGERAVEGARRGGALFLLRPFLETSFREMKRACEKQGREKAKSFRLSLPRA